MLYEWRRLSWHIYKPLENACFVVIVFYLKSLSNPFKKSNSLILTFICCPIVDLLAFFIFLIVLLLTSNCCLSFLIIVLLFQDCLQEPDTAYLINANYI